MNQGKRQSKQLYKMKNTAKKTSEYVFQARTQKIPDKYYEVMRSYEVRSLMQFDIVSGTRLNRLHLTSNIIFVPDLTAYQEVNDIFWITYF